MMWKTCWGRAAFGVVYRARQSAVQREVAIKVILPKYANSPEFIRHFESEAQVVARLEHPHIVPLYDYWREPDSAYLVMRYLRGGSLRDLIHQRGKIDIDTTFKIMEQVGAALAFAHSNGVVHRDVKADNILLDELGNAYLSDFGIAKDLGDEGVAAGGDIMGTPAYLAPEQIRGRDVGPQSDVYTFGIMLYEMLSGSRPFAELTLATLVYKHLNDPLPMIDTSELDLPASFNDIIQRATAKSPADRYQSFQDLLSEFQLALRQDVGDSDDFLEELDFSEFELLETKNPYKGLRAFQQADADDFFGRTDMIARVLGRLQEKVAQGNFLAVIGPSGSGKSSLVKAGVLPALRQGRIPGSRDWFYAEMVPGEVPLEELSAALLSVSNKALPNMLDTLREHDDGLTQGVREALPSADSKLVLMIDQFEELFTQVERESDRQQFLQLILDAVNAPDSPLIIIATLRADFYDRPLLYQGFGELIRSRTELVLPLNDEELAETISGPAFRVGAVIEDGLIDRIIADVREQPGALPLLQYALTELFERREGALLTNDAYTEIGGTLGALARRAEEVFRRFDDAGQNMARQMFLRLVTLGEGQEDTRRRILQSELLTLGDSAVVENVIDRFGRYRLLTFDRDDVTRSATVEVAHEALIRQWERLREWLMESRTDIRLERELLQAATDWQSAQQDRSYLMSGNRLATYEEWAETATLQLNTLERGFLEASLAARAEEEALELARQERERELERLKARNLRIAAIIFGLAALVAVILSVFAFDQRNQADEQRMIAESEREAADDARAVAEDAREVADQQRIIAEDAREVADQQRMIAEDNVRKNHSLALAANAGNALSEHNPALALTLAIEAVNAYDPPQAEAHRILGAAAFAPGPRYKYDFSKRSVLAVAASSDGNIGAIGSSDGSISIVDNATGDLLHTIDAGAPVIGLHISPDDQLIAAALSSADGANATAGEVGIWHIETGDEVSRLAGHEHIVTDVEFSPDGALLASSSADSTARIWDVTTGGQLHILRAHIDYVISLSFSPDGDRLATSSAAIGVAESIRTPEHNTIQVWDVASGQRLLTIPPSGIGFFRDVEFSPDGATIAASTWESGDGGMAVIYDAATGAELRRFFAHDEVMSNIEFSLDGKQLVTASRDASIKFWDIARGVQVASFIDFGTNVQDIEFAGDGGYMMVAVGRANDYPDGSDNPLESAAYLWDLRNREQERAYTGHDSWVWTVDISPDATLLASGSGPLSSPAGADTTVRIWDAATGEEVHKFFGHTNTVDSVKFIADGQQVLSASWDGTIRRWDLAAGRESQRYSNPPVAGRRAAIYMIELLPDGETFVAGSGDGSIRLWHIDSGEILAEYSGHSMPVNGVHVSDDGALMASASGGWGGSADRTVRLWDIASGDLLQTFEGHSHIVNYARISPDNRFIISTSWDDTVRMWDIETGEEIRQFVGHAGNTFGIDISADSSTLLTTSQDTTVRLWDIASGEELHRYAEHTDWVQEVFFAPDEQSAVSAGQDGTLRSWIVKRTPADLIDWASRNRYLRELTCAERESYRLHCPPDS